MTQPQVFITGGGGYLGSRLARKYLDETNLDVHLWLHAQDELDFHAKRDWLIPLFQHVHARVTYSWGDLASPDPFASIVPHHIEHVIHSAAVTRFNVDAETARSVNIEGTRKLLRFADRCSSLQAIGLLSTVYASGLQAGLVEEVALSGHVGFANYYEHSKWAAETILLTDFPHLPWRILRTGTVIADDTDGTVTQYNAFHNTLKLLYYGLLSLLPGHAQTPLYFVTGTFVAQAIVDLMVLGSNQAIYHVAHTKEESLSLESLISCVFSTFESHPDFSRRRVLKPLFTDHESFLLLESGVSQFSGQVINQAISSISPFAKQLFVDKTIQNHRLKALLPTYQAPDPQELVRQICIYLVRTKWGREVVHASL